jgi:hypothetical protein
MCYFLLQGRNFYNRSYHYVTTEVECIQFYNRENPEPRNNKEKFCSFNNDDKPNEVLQIDIIRLLGKLIVTVVGNRVTNELQRTHRCQDWNRKYIYNIYVVINNPMKTQLYNIQEARIADIMV